MKKNVLKGIIILLCALVLYYFWLPPINLTSPEFWQFLIVMLIIIIIAHTSVETSKIKVTKNNMHFDGNPFNFGKAKVVLVVVALVVTSILVINLVCSPLFQSKKYGNRIEVLETTDFTTDITEVDFTKIPLLDKDSSQKLGDRKMGQMTDLVSQFEVSNAYTQINYNNDIVRVTPLNYAGLIKYFTNRNEGIAGYITVNSVTGDANLVRLEKGMKYSPSAYFFENLKRKLRLNYPTTIFGEMNFEIDNEGNPYWVVQTIKVVY